MTWVKLDDGFYRHPKARAAGRDGRSLFLAGLCYSAANLTDGVIVKAALPLIAAEAEVRPTTAALLVSAGLWTDEGDRYVIHGYLDYNPPRSQKLAERDAAKERMARNRSPNVRANNQRTTTEVREKFEKRSPYPVPVPVPVPVPQPVPQVQPQPSNQSVELELRANGVDRARPDPVRVVFDAWREATGKHRAVLDAKRRSVIASALKTHPPPDLVDAVRGWRHSPHHRGENDRRTVYNELDLLLRTAAKIEHFRDLERREEWTRSQTLTAPSGMAAVLRLAETGQ